MRARAHCLRFRRGPSGHVGASRVAFVRVWVPWLAKRAGFLGDAARRKAWFSANVPRVLPRCQGAALALRSDPLRLSSAATRENRCSCHLQFPEEEGSHKEVKPTSCELSVASESSS